MSISPRVFAFVVVAFILNFVIVSLAFASLFTLNFGLFFLLLLSLIVVPVIAGIIVGYRGFQLVLLFIFVLLAGFLMNMILPGGDAGIAIIRSAFAYFVAALAVSMVRK